MENKKEKDQEQIILKPREELDLLSNKSGIKKDLPEKEKENHYPIDKWDSL